MEALFIQQIFKLTENILRGDYQFDSAFKELQNARAKAQKLGLPRYEAEVLNTLGILYDTIGDSVQGKQSYLESLQKSRQTDDIDLKLKLLNNLSGMYLVDWDFQSANKHLTEAIALGRQNNLKTLGMLYLYSNIVNYWVLQGDYQQASALIEEAWKMAEGTDLLKYSRYEYFQVIFLLRNTHTTIHIAQGKCEAALTPLRLVLELVKNTKNAEYHTLTRVSQFYYALCCKHDEAEAKQWEAAAVEASGGKLAASMALNIALFMQNNHQPEWAQKYARYVLDQAKTSQSLPTTMLDYAKHILEPVK